MAEPEVMVVQQPGMMQQGYAIGPNGQPMPMGGGPVIVNQVQPHILSEMHYHLRNSFIRARALPTRCGAWLMH